MLQAPASPLPPPCICASVSCIINFFLLNWLIGTQTCYHAVISPTLKQYFYLVPSYSYSHHSPMSLLSFTAELSKRVISQRSLFPISLSRLLIWKHSDPPLGPTSLWKLLWKATNDLHIAKPSGQFFVLLLLQLVGFEELANPSFLIHFLQCFPTPCCSFFSSLICWFLFICPTSKCWATQGSVHGLLCFFYTHSLADLIQSHDF